VKKIYILDAYIQIWNKIISFNMKKEKKSKTSRRKNEEKGDIESPRSESLSFKGGIPIMLGPIFCISEV
jgi:hypothetical protein